MSKTYSYIPFDTRVTDFLRNKLPVDVEYNTLMQHSVLATSLATLRQRIFYRNKYLHMRLMSQPE